MKSATFFFKDNYLVCTDDSAVALCVSMLAYSEGEMLKIIDDDGSEVYIKLTRVSA